MTTATIQAPDAILLKIASKRSAVGNATNDIPARIRIDGESDRWYAPSDIAFSAQRGLIIDAVAVSNSEANPVSGLGRLWFLESAEYMIPLTPRHNPYGHAEPRATWLHVGGGYYRIAEARYAEDVRGDLQVHLTMAGEVTE